MQSGSDGSQQAGKEEVHGAQAMFTVIAPKPNYDEALVFGEDCLVDVPARLEMRKDDGAHGDGGLLCSVYWLCKRVEYLVVANVLRGLVLS